MAILFCFHRIVVIANGNIIERKGRRWASVMIFAMMIRFRVEALQDDIVVGRRMIVFHGVLMALLL